MSVTVGGTYIEARQLLDSDGRDIFQWEFLEKVSIDSATSQVAMSMADYSSTYTDIKLEYYGIEVTTDGAEVVINFSTDSQSTWNTTQSAYHERSTNFVSNRTTFTDVYQSAQDGLYGGFNLGNAANEGITGTTTIQNAFDSEGLLSVGTFAHVRQQFGSPGVALFFGLMYPATTITDFGLKPRAGNVDAGEILIYGRR